MCGAIAILSRLFEHIVGNQKAYGNYDKHNAYYQHERHAALFILAVLAEVVKRAVLARSNVPSEQAEKYVRAVDKYIEAPPLLATTSSPNPAIITPGTKNESLKICMTCTVSVSANTPFAPIIIKAMAMAIAAVMPY